MVLREGKRIRLDAIELRVMPSLFPRSRVAVIVPKHRQTIVSRNRLKRRLRELVRLDLLPSLRTQALDVVLRATPRAYEWSFDALRLDVQRAATRLAA